MLATRKGRTSVDKARPFNISKREVWLAYKRVRENRGAAGVDDQTIAEFEKDLSNNLYRLWNRMSSGSYMPPPVRRVDIPKGDGRGTRSLGIPTVSDRIAQMVVKRYLEPVLEPVFHDDSFGYRPGRSAHDALAAARQRCWRFDWVLDLDIKGFFDNIDWELLMRAVRRHTDCAWVLLYIESWMKENNPDIPFERYADDAICHCRSEAQALSLRQALEARLAACKLELHPQKTKIVYCKDSNRPNGYPEQRFDFLGFTFRPRQSMNRAGKLFVSFSPAVSDKAAKAMREDVRRWKLHHRNDLDLEKSAQGARPILVGWVNYYGRFHRSALRRALRTVDPFIVRWAQRKYKRLRGHAKRAWGWLRGVKSRQPNLFAHWSTKSPVGAIGAG